MLFAKHFKNLFTALLIIAITITANSAMAQAALKKETLSEKKFEKKIKKKNAVVIDVRTAEEYKEGHIPNAINIDVQKDDFKQQALQFNKSKTYLLYCRTGKRSAKALNILKQNGFEKVYHLNGGFTDWKGAKEQ